MGVTLRSGRVLLPAAWHEDVDASVADDDIVLDDSSRKRLANVGGARIVNKISYCGVVEPNRDFTDFTLYGRVCHLTPGGELPSVPLFENQIAERSDGSLAMLIRGDLTNRLWRSDSYDGGHHWTDPVPTNIPNPGSKPLIINLPDGRIVLFNNPSEKDYDDTAAHHHAYRTPLTMWVSDDDMAHWSIKRTLVEAPRIAQYPDGFYDQDWKAIYLCWEDDREVSFARIPLSELEG